MRKSIQSRAVLAMMFVVALVGAAIPAIAQAPAGRMLRPRLLIHVVADVEKSVAFYRDNLDFQVVSGPDALTASALLQKAKATAPAATARQATLSIPPGSNARRSG